MKAKFLVPLILFLVLVGFLMVGLGLNPREVPSPLIDKPAPAFRLARLDQPEQQFSLDEMRGQVWLLNVWASWCITCRQEHPVLVDLARSGIVPIIGLNYKEVRGDNAIDARNMPLNVETGMAIERAQTWLNRHGNPYTLSVLDIDGRVGIDFGVYGVPETFLIDQNGRIRYKHTGAVDPTVLREILVPKIEELKRAG